MPLSSDLWQANLDLAQSCLEHPFIQGIADGTLPRKQFAYYVGQDIIYLEALARVYAIAAARSPDWKSFCTLSGVIDSIHEELDLYKNYAVEWKIDIQMMNISVTTRRYTEFLFATAWNNDTGLIATALAPCARLYMFLGQKIAQKGIPDHAYSDWIRANSKSAAEGLTQRLEHLTDRFAHAAPLVYSTYRYSLTCELEFFQAAWDLQN